MENASSGQGNFPKKTFSPHKPFEHVKWNNLLPSWLWRCSGPSNQIPSGSQGGYSDRWERQWNFEPPPVRIICLLLKHNIHCTPFGGLHEMPSCHYALCCSVVKYDIHWEMLWDDCSIKQHAVSHSLFFLFCMASVTVYFTTEYLI